MYLCICKGITEEKARALLKRSKSTKEVLKKLGIGDDCGSCMSYALEYLKSPKDTTKHQARPDHQSANQSKN